MIIKSDQDQIQSYLSDAANYRGYCDAVYFPESESEIVEIISEANRLGTPVTIAGNGTGLTGARVPEGGIVLSTEKMNRIIEINLKEKYAIVQPAVLVKEFKQVVENNNLFYPPDPTEQNCFIGANIATNASGAKTFKYGPTRSFVLALNVVLPNGETVKLERGRQKTDNYRLNLITENGNKIVCQIPDYEMPQTKHAAGYFCKKNMDAVDLFIGSEGTLGVISGIKLKLLDKPQHILSSVVFFDVEQNALNFLYNARNLSLAERKKITGKSIDALALEFFDKNALSFLIEDFPRIPTKAEAAVWFEQEYVESNFDFLMNEWTDLIDEFKGDENNSWFASNEKERENFKDFRHAVSWKVSEYIAQKNLLKVGTDTAVPHRYFDEFYHYSKNLVRESTIEFVSYGHFGNSHLHLNMLPKNEVEYKKAKRLYEKILTKAVELKGTISAEHGIGKLKRNYLLKMYGKENIIKMAKLKKCLDPNLILGLGNIIEPSIMKNI